MRYYNLYSSKKYIYVVEFIEGKKNEKIQIEMSDL